MPGGALRMSPVMTAGPDKFGSGGRQALTAAVAGFRKTGEAVCTCRRPRLNYLFYTAPEGRVWVYHLGCFAGT